MFVFFKKFYDGFAKFSAKSAQLLAKEIKCYKFLYRKPISAYDGAQSEGSSAECQVQKRPRRGVRIRVARDGRVQHLKTIVINRAACAQQTKPPLPPKLPLLTTLNPLKNVNTRTFPAAAA